MSVGTEWGKLPWATMLAVLFTITAGVVSLVDSEALNFDEYTTQVAVVWGFLAVGRGLALKEQETVEMSPFSRFLNTFPWATVVVGIVAVVGYIVVIIGDTSLTWDELGIKLGLLIGALGVGRGAGVLKKDLMTYPASAGQPFDPGHEITEGDIKEIEQPTRQGKRKPGV